MSLLLVEDDFKIASFVIRGLKDSGFEVDHMNDGEDGLRMALNESYDAAIIDIMLPKIDGLALIKKLRKQKINLPILILSAKRSISDKVKGLQAGSDDYLTKLFAFDTRSGLNSQG